MESQQKQVIHLYEFEQQSINEKQLSKQILESLKPYFNQKSPQIKIIGRPHKYWAYFEIEPEIASKLNELKTVKIGDNTLNIGRYYYDYQIFINKLDPKITPEQVIEYFQQFGDVVDIVITDPADKKKDDFKHCYIKMKDQKTIDRVVLAKIHKIQDKDIKPVRTFGLEEDKESDKKLFLKIQRLQGTPGSIQQFEQNAIQFFMKHGKIRERPKLQNTNTNTQKYKMIITYTSPKDAANAIQAFPSSNLYADYQKKNVNLILNYFHSKENKIFASGLKDNAQAVVKECFQVFGEISEITLAKGKFNGALTAVIGFVNQNDYKMALATYTQYPKILALFTGKPYITIFMSNQQKKSFNEMKKRQNQGQFQHQFAPQNRPMMYFPQNPDQLGMNPQFRQMPMGQPGMMPPQNMIPSNKMPPPNMIQPGMIPPNPNMGMGQGNMNQNFSRPPIPWGN